MNRLQALQDAAGSIVCHVESKLPDEAGFCIFAFDKEEADTDHLAFIASVEPEELIVLLRRGADLLEEQLHAVNLGVSGETKCQN